MKMKGFSVVIVATILSGCTSMMYGGGIAPVNNQNTYYGQQPTVQQVPQQTPVVANTAVPHTVTTVQSVPPSVQQQQAEIARQQQLAQAEVARQQQLAQAEVARQQQLAREQAQKLAEKQAEIQVSTTSPYATATPATPNATPPVRSVEDGWSVRPNTPPTATDTPKVATDTSTATPPQQTTAPQPVRPPERDANVQDPPVQEKTVASTPPSAEKTPSETQVASAQPAGNRPASGNGSAVSTLLQKANSELGKGNLDGAAAYLEDAHRIDSKNANILYDIANIRYHQKRYREAEAAAARAANLGGNSNVMRKSWSLIANARKALGDNQGAIAAAEKAASF